MIVFALAPLSPLVSMGVGDGLGGGCIGRAMCHPFTPRWGSVYGSTFAPNWDFGHYVDLGPYQWHFQHRFGRPKYRILCSVISFMVAPSTMEGIRMCPTSLPMSRVFTVIMGVAGLFMYESSGSIPRTSPILLAMIVKTFVFLNCL